MSEEPKAGPWNDFVDDLVGGSKPKPKVIIVDDSNVVRNEIRHFLTGRNCEIIEAVDGVDGLEKVRANPDVLLMFLDINMPNMDGLTLADRIAAEVGSGALQRFPIVMLTTESTKEKVVRAKQAGVLGWIIKPAKKEHIVTLFDRFVAGRTAA